MFHICPILAVMRVEDIAGVAEVDFLLFPLYFNTFQVEIPISGEEVVDAPAVESSREGMTGIVHRKGNTRTTDETTFKTMSSLFFHSSLFPFMEMSDYGQPWRRDTSMHQDTVVQVLAAFVKLEVDEGVRPAGPVVVEALADPAHAVSAPSSSAPDGLAVKST